MQRIEHVVRRLDEWAEWMARKLDGGATRCSVISSAYTGMGRIDRPYGSRLPYGAAGNDNSDAALTDQLLIRLGEIDHAAQQALILVHWRGRRDSMAYNARKLGVSRNCLHERCCRGDACIDRWLREASDVRKGNLETITARA